MLLVKLLNSSNVSDFLEENSEVKCVSSDILPGFASWLYYLLLCVPGQIMNSSVSRFPQLLYTDHDYSNCVIGSLRVFSMCNFQNVEHVILMGVCSKDYTED